MTGTVGDRKTGALGAIATTTRIRAGTTGPENGTGAVSGDHDMTEDIMITTMKRLRIVTGDTWMTGKRKNAGMTGESGTGTGTGTVTTADRQIRGRGHGNDAKQEVEAGADRERGQVLSRSTL